MVITSTMIGILVAYASGTIIGGIMMWRNNRKSEVDVIAYTIEMLIESKFIKTKVNAKSEVVLMAYDSEEEEEE